MQKTDNRWNSYIKWKIFQPFAENPRLWHSKTIVINWDLPRFMDASNTKTGNVFVTEDFNNSVVFCFSATTLIWEECRRLHCFSDSYANLWVFAFWIYDLKTILLLKSAFLCVFRFFGLSSFDTVTTLILSRLVSFHPFFEVIPEIFCNFVKIC